MCPLFFYAVCFQYNEIIRHLYYINYYIFIIWYLEFTVYSIKREENAIKLILFAINAFIS